MLGYTASFNVTRQSTKHICLWLLVCFILIFTSSSAGEPSIVMSVSVREHISGTADTNFHKFLCVLSTTVARFSSGNVAVIICFRFCVWRHFPIMRPHPRRHDATAALAAASLRRRAHPCYVVWFVSCCCRVTTKLCSGGASYGRVSVCLSVTSRSFIETAERHQWIRTFSDLELKQLGWLSMCG